MTGPAVTVLFSSYNGARTLPRTLEALCRQTLPQTQWKLVAVDNNSTDDTRAILESYRDRLPIEVLFEPRQGKESALALGFGHLEGELVILTDDDVIPEPDWIEQFLSVAAENPDFGIFGGLIEPEWEKRPEAWLLEAARLGVLYALNDDLAEGPISATLISGPNSAFRRAAIGRDYVVHDNLGPNAKVAQYPMGQDTAFALGIERRGVRAFHSRRPKLRHIIRPNYVDPGWMLRRAERFGMGLVAVRPELFGRKLKIAGMPAGAMLSWCATEPVARLLEPLPLKSMRFKVLWGQAVRRGILKQFAANRSAAAPRGVGAAAAE